MLYSKTSNIRTILFVLMLMLSLVGNGQHLFFKELAIFNDESELSILDILIDDDGIIWIASDDGLVESDGGNIYRYTIEDNEHGDLTTLHHKNGILYFGWQDGSLSVYSTTLRKTLSTRNLSESPITAIVVDDQGFIWAGSSENGVVILKGDQSEILDVNFGLIDNIVNDLIYSPIDSSVYVATDRGISICYSNKGKIETINYSASDGLSDNFITALFISDKNILWAGSYTGKVYRLGENGFNEFEIEKYDLDKITGINANYKGVWVTTLNSGIVILYNNGDIERVKSNFDLVNLNNSYLFNENKLLIQKGKNELLLSDTRLQFYQGSEYPICSNISLIYDTGEEHYIANDKGIYVENNGRIWKEIDLEEENIEYVISMLKSSNGDLWFGTFDQGLFRYSNGKLIQYDESDSLINNNVMTIHEWNGEIWTGTLGGLSSIKISEDSVRISSYSKEQGLEAPYIYQLYSKDDKLYIATEGNGLISYDGAQFYNSTDGEIESAYDITGTKDSTLYISTKNHGIVQYENQKVKRKYPIKYKNKAILIESIDMLQEDMIIFDWEKGFGILNTSDGLFQLFDDAYGLANFDNDFLNVLSSTANRKGYLGSANYMVVYSQSKRKKMDESKSLIRNIELFSNPIDTAQHLFSYDQNHFSFRIRSNWIQDPLHVNMEYRLKGLSSEWISTKDQLITFAKLAPGEYTFELRSGLASSIESSQIKTYSFIIKKPFYLTWWFFLAIVLLIGGSVYVFTKYRNKRSLEEKKLEYERVLSQFELLKSQVNPHFLFNSLNTAYALINREDEEARDYLLSLSKYLRAILMKNQEHVISLEKELVFAENYTKLQQKRFGDNLRFRFEELSTNVLESFIPPLSLQILIENAIKHNVISKTDPLTVRIYVEDNFLVVENNLKEKKENGEGTKIGLSNIQSRYKLLFDKDIIIEKNDLFFIVKLPIIENYVKNITD